MTKPLSRNELAAVGATDAELARALVAKARAAMRGLSGASQQALDECVTALAWSHYRIEAATELAEIAVRDTGLGNAADKIEKVRRKTFGTLRDLSRVKSTGIIEELPALGLVKYAKPVGVVAALCPTTNPASTAVNKAMMAVKGGNAIVLAPSPSAWTTIARSAELMRDALAKIGRPADLVQILPRPVTKLRTDALMAACDLVVATGSADNVRRAYQSGTPAIGVGTGNVPVIVDSSADVAGAARKIAASKIFDNATSCSSENAVIVLAGVYDAALTALADEGGYLAGESEKRAIAATLWQDGTLNRELIAKGADLFARLCGLPREAGAARFFIRARRSIPRRRARGVQPGPSAGDERPGALGWVIKRAGPVSYPSPVKQFACRCQPKKRRPGLS